MSLKALFSSGNTGNTGKNVGVTATDHALYGGNTGNTGNTAKNTFKVKNESNNAFVICYTPNGQAFNVQATSPEHAEFLQRMNPKPQEKTP